MWVSLVLCVTPCMGFGAVRGVCVASHLWACVCPPSSVLPLVWVSVLYVGCVSRPICGRVCVPRPLCEPVCGARMASSVLPLVWVSVLYVGCVSRPICGRVCVPRPPCYPLYGFQCCTWGVCRVPSVGVCVSPVHCVSLSVALVVPGVCFTSLLWASGYPRSIVSLITWSLSPPGVDTYFLISLRSICYHRNTVSPQLQHSNILFLKLPWWS